MQGISLGKVSDKNLPGLVVVRRRGGWGERELMHPRTTETGQWVQMVRLATTIRSDAPKDGQYLCLFPDSMMPPCIDKSALTRH